MAKRKKDSASKSNKNVKLTRKQQRKQERKNKKQRKHEYYTNRNKPGQFELAPEKDENLLTNKTKLKQMKIGTKDTKVNNQNLSNQTLTSEEQIKKEKKQQLKLQKEMNVQRRKQLLEANYEEDRNIKRLEKQLKLNKRKTKSVPKSFSTDGLDYLLEVCDSKSMGEAVNAEQQLAQINDEFEEDFALMTGKELKKSSSKETAEVGSDSEGDDFEAFLNEDDLSEGSDLESDAINEESEDEFNDSEDDSSTHSSSTTMQNNNNNNDNKRKSDHKEMVGNVKKQKTSTLDSDIGSDFEETGEDLTVGKNKKQTSDKTNEDFESNSNEELDSEPENSTECDEVNEKGKTKQNPDGTWEDIYGRLRDKNGAVISKSEGKYVPPAIRAKLLESTNSEDKKRIEKLSRLQKQLKGLLNRLAESNMHSIASQIEDLYMNNSRNDMNDTIMNLMLESLISHVITPERLLMEHVLLITILHANVGTEVGAHFLQTMVKKFDEYHKENHEIENKKLDNTVKVIAQLYNFKLFEAKLVYEILQRLSDRFEEKDVECILHILRSVGFSLRKDNPIALKNLILSLQKQAGGVSDDVKDNSRVKFMLDILLAIKNNNMSKIPNYDTTYSEHLKKILKGFIRKGNYVTQLNISLEDLLKADERGRWWVVGSAWTGNIKESAEIDKKAKVKSEGFSQKLLEIARKQRMNTDTRRNIFCIIMTAEDYLDAFEKLLHLGLKNQQDREIIHVILHCCLQEKTYNPYYAVLSQKFCDYDRKYQMTIKYSVWDKLKTLNEHSGNQISNLAKLLTYLFLEKALSISTLKIVQFSELDKVTLRFMRQILLGILLSENEENLLGVFEKIAHSDKLKMFKESLRLFIHHFLLKNLNSGSIKAEEKELLETRAKLVDKILVSKDSKTKF